MQVGNFLTGAIAGNDGSNDQLAVLKAWPISPIFGITAAVSQVAIGGSKLIRANLMLNHGDDPRLAEKLGGLISMEAVLWALSAPSAATVGGAAGVLMAVVNGVGSLAKFIRGILKAIEAPKWVQGVLVTLEAICGLVGSIAGFAINGVVKSLSALFGAVVNAIKSIHGLSTTKEGWSER